MEPSYQVKTPNGLLGRNHCHLIASPNEHFDDEINADLESLPDLANIDSATSNPDLSNKDSVIGNPPDIPTKTELCTHVVEGHQDLQSAAL